MAIVLLMQLPFNTKLFLKIVNNNNYIKKTLFLFPVIHLKS